MPTQDLLKPVPVACMASPTSKCSNKILAVKTPNTTDLRMRPLIYVYICVCMYIELMFVYGVGIEISL